MDTTHITPIVRDSLTQLRELNGWSAAELADRIGVNRTTVWRWMTDGPDDATAALITAVLQVHAPHVLNAAPVQLAS